MKKVVVKLDLHDDKAKQKAIKTVSTISGIDSISMDMKEEKLTVIGDVDPIVMVSKLRKSFRAHIESIGPVKEPEKKKEDPPQKKPEQEKRKDEPNKKEKEKEKKKDQNMHVAGIVNEYRPSFTIVRPQMMTAQYYCIQSAEENLNLCVFC